MNFDENLLNDTSTQNKILETSSLDFRKQSVDSEKMFKSLFGKKNSFKSDISAQTPNVQRNFLEDLQFQRNMTKQNFYKKPLFYSEIEDKDISEAFQSHSEQFQNPSDLQNQKHKIIENYLFQKQQKMELIELKSEQNYKDNFQQQDDFNSLLKELNLVQRDQNQNESINQIVNSLKDMNFFVSKPKFLKEDFNQKESLDILKRNLQYFFQKFSIDTNQFILMTSQQKDFFLGLLKNKFLFTDDLKVIKFKSKIRRENKSKYIVKKGIKYLFKKFKQKNNCFIKGKKILDEEEFYSYYFKCLQNEKFPIQSVYLPGSKLSQKSMKNPIFKTIKTDYLKLIFKAQEFRNDFCKYLNNDFLSSQIKERNQKIDTIIEKFVNKVSTQKIKLPWTNKELIDAKNLLIDIIDNIKEA